MLLVGSAALLLVVVEKKFAVPDSVRALRPVGSCPSLLRPDNLR